MIDSAVNVAPRGNYVNGVDQVLNKPRARVYNNSGASIATGTNVYVTWELAEWDTDGMWKPSTPTRLNCRTSGLYLVSVDVQWIAAAAGSLRQVQIQKNRTYFYLQQNIVSIGGGFPDSQTHSEPVAMVAGDYLEVQVTQVSGGPLQFNGSTLSNRLNGFQACLISLP